MRNKILPLLLCYFFQIVSTNAHAQGGPLPLNSSVNGNLTSATADVWDITTTSDGLLRLTFSTVSPADLYVSLFDNDGTTLIAGPLESFNSSTVVLNADGLAAGNYHVKITPYNAAYGTYTLADSLFISPLAKDIEPNGTTATALVLPQNGKKTGHIGHYYNNVRDTMDWYKVTTTADGLLRVYLSTERTAAASSNTLDVNMTLYDNNGTTQLASVEVFNGNGPATNIITADGLQPGTYYIKLQSYAASQFADYTISDSLFTPSLANDAEPNGSAAGAVVLPLNGSKTGHVGYYYNNQRDTADWYKITTTADGLLRVYLTSARGSVYSGNTLDVNMTLYDNDGTTQLGAVEIFNGNGPATNLITADGLAPGTYYVKVQPYSTSQFADYTISDSLFLPPLAIDAEPNGTRATAVALPQNNKTTGHVGYYYNNQRDTADWYKITTTADGLLRVYLTSARGSVYSNNTLDVNMTLYDNNGTTQLGAVEIFNGGGPATNLITADGLAPGTYYIKVQPYSTSQFADYTISDSLFVPTLAIDAEPNGTRATAFALPQNGKTTGHVGYYYDNQRDTADWYKITTTADGLLRVYLTTARGSVYSGNTLDVNMTLYDNDGNSQLAAVEVFNGNGPASNLLTADGLAPGTYYVKIQPYSTSQFADYTISDSLFLPLIANDAEPNGTLATAPVFALNSSTEGHAGYYYNHQRDTADWYKITTIAPGPLYIYLNSYRGSIYSTNTLDMILSIYSSDGTTQLGSKEVFAGNGPAVDSLSFVTLPAGTYFIKVTDYSSSQFATYALSNSVTPGNLPVTFINFDGILGDSKAILNWSTATEINNKGFEVEKSTDGQLFTGIGFVTGNGNSSIVNTYQYTDNKVLSGFNYYRLRQVDLDGNFKYSATIRLDFSKFAWAVFGNPVTTNTWLQLQVDKKVKVVIQVHTADGKLIKTIDKGNISKGTYSIPLSLANAPSGIYIVTLVIDNQRYPKTIIK
ncbi:MAG: T9SS type A sorting domain-containing protein [Ferruginibacter sp.]